MANSHLKASLISPPSRATHWYAVSFIAIAFEWVFMKSALGIVYTNILGTILKMAGDVALILLPYWLLPARWRKLTMIPIWLYAIWCIANLAYYRFWNELIPPAAVTMSGNLNGELLSYAWTLLSWRDLLIIGIPCCGQILLHRLHPSSAPPYKHKLLLVSASLLLGLAGQFAYFKTFYSWFKEENPVSRSEALRTHLMAETTSWARRYERNGPLWYVVRFSGDILTLLRSSVDLSSEQRAEIGAFLQSELLYAQVLPDQPTDGTVHMTKPIPGILSHAPGYIHAAPDSMNVVYIIVESLNSDIIGKRIAGQPVMPVLDSLSRTEGTVFFDNVVSQTKVSASSDGHLLLLTGLLPPEKLAYSITYGAVNRFPSLADALPCHDRYLLLADEGTWWNEDRTLENFGLGHPLVIADRPEYPVERFGRDASMFMQAKELLATISRPFFMTLMTISMHIPFKEEAVHIPSFIADAQDIGENERNYAAMCSYTDRCIGDFLSAVPENTIVFIASDHSQSLTADTTVGQCGVMMALNTGLTRRISRTVGQVNLFPATLDLLGIGSITPGLHRSTTGSQVSSSTGFPSYESLHSRRYRGLAPSALDPRVDGTVDAFGNVYGTPTDNTLDSLSQAFRISDLIIRSDYFDHPE